MLNLAGCGCLDTCSIPEPGIRRRSFFVGRSYKAEGCAADFRSRHPLPIHIQVTLHIPLKPTCLPSSPCSITLALGQAARYAYPLLYRNRALIWLQTHSGYESTTATQTRSYSDEEAFDVVVVDPTGHVINHKYASAPGQQPDLANSDTDIAELTSWFGSIRAS
jgi:hypothetical protein